MADYTRYCRGTHPYPSQEGIFRPYNVLMGIIIGLLGLG
jgi:hypothetical protein